MIKQDPNNYRSHDGKNKELIKKSLENLGAGRSIVIDNEGYIVAGNGVHEQAEALGIPVRVVESDGKELIVVKRTDLKLGDEKRKELALADNATSDTSEWDTDALLGEWDADQLAEWGVELPEWEEEEVEPHEDSGPGEIPEQPNTVLGDLYELNEHRVICGDSTDSDAVGRLMNGCVANVLLTDPPYGLGDSNTNKNAYNKHNDTPENLKEIIDNLFPIAELYADTHVFTTGIANMFLYPKPTWVMGWFTPAGIGRGPWGFCCWQPILCYGGDPKLKKGLGSHPDAIVHTESSEDFGHPCTKPINFWCWLVERVSEKGESILDTFLGSGTGLIAAEITSRVCFGIDFDEKYIDVSVKRWVKYMKENDKPFTVKRNGEDITGEEWLYD